MYFERLEHPKHTGTEQYAVSFQLKEQDDLYDVKGQHVQFMIRPETVHLRWERHRRDNGYGPWRRRTFGSRGGARIEGGRVLKDGSTSDKQTSYVEVFAISDLGGPLTKYAASLPHLEQMIAELEKSLPS